MVLDNIRIRDAHLSIFNIMRKRNEGTKVDNFILIL